jgi:hypothetical protein
MIDLVPLVPGRAVGWEKKEAVQKSVCTTTRWTTCRDIITLPLHGRVVLPEHRSAGAWKGILMKSRAGSKRRHLANVLLTAHLGLGFPPQPIPLM